MKKVLEIPIGSNDCENYKRLDHFLAQKLPEFSRSFIKHLFAAGLITAGQEKLELDRMPARECLVRIVHLPPTPTQLIPENIPLDILYEDEYLLLVNKPAGMTVHPAPGNYTGTLVHALMGYLPSLGAIGVPTRPGIVHRLDKGTSGVMAIAKESKTHEKLSQLFANHTIKRQYECLVRGLPTMEQGTLQSTIGRHPFKRQKMAINVKRGRQAITHYRAINKFTSFSHLCLTLETGRTHQIRVHLSSLLKTPVLNDPLYGNPPQDKAHLGERAAAVIGTYPHPFLHAQSLGFTHPITGLDLSYQVDPPEIFRQVYKALREDA